MGNREQLLDAAKQCLIGKGYERTTVRDISDLAGVSKAAIGYHFGSKEALMNAALFELLGGGGGDVSPTAEAADPDTTPAQRLTALWTKMMAAYGGDKTFWAANLESVLVAYRDESVREHLSTGFEAGRSGITSVLTGIEESELPPETIRTLGSVQMALLSGVMIQYLLNPDTAPSAEELFQGIHALAAITPSSGEVAQGKQ